MNMNEKRGRDVVMIKLNVGMKSISISVIVERNQYCNDWYNRYNVYTYLL